MRILCLFEFSGVFQTLYSRLGYEVTAIDKILGSDIRSFNYYDIPQGRVAGIIAHPPCTEFAVSGCRWWPEKAKSKPHLLKEAKELVQITLDIIAFHKPRFWFIENPVGRLSSYFNELQKPRLKFDPWEYAGWVEPPWSNVYSKKTCLWGDFQIPERKPIDPGTVKSKMHNMSSSWKIERSITPIGFARAFVEANK